MYLIVQYEDMSINEQMQHRIGNLPAFRIFSQASPLCMHLMEHACIMMVLTSQTSALMAISGIADVALLVLQGRRYVADGQQSLRDLVDTIEARTASCDNSLHPRPALLHDSNLSQG